MLSDNVYSTDLYADDTTIYDMQDDLETLQVTAESATFSCKPSDLVQKKKKMTCY